MKSILDEVEDINSILRQLHKLDSKMQSGQFIGAYRDLHRIIAFFEMAKKNAIANEPVSAVDNFNKIGDNGDK